MFRAKAASMPITAIRTSRSSRATSATPFAPTRRPVRATGRCPRPSCARNSSVAPASAKARFAPRRFLTHWRDLRQIPTPARWCVPRWAKQIPPNAKEANHPDSNPAKDNKMADTPIKPWQELVYDLLKAANIKFFTYVPDGGHKQLIIRCNEDPDVTAVPLTIETEGVAFAAGAHLGGKRSVLLQQGSGVGNCINMLSLIDNGRFPFLTLVTMRGDFGEGNPWPMASDSSAALGLALSQPEKRVLLVTGDGELLMSLGSLATIGVMQPKNLSILIVDNELYGETGDQNTHTSYGVNLAGVAENCGISITRLVTTKDQIPEASKLLRRSNGPCMVVIKVAGGLPGAYSRNWHAEETKLAFRRALLGHRGRS